MTVTIYDPNKQPASPKYPNTVSRAAGADDERDALVRAYELLGRIAMRANVVDSK